MHERARALLNSGWWADALIQRAQLDRDMNERRAAAGVPITVPHVEHHAGHELTEWERAWIHARIVDTAEMLLHAHDEGIATLEIDEHEHVVSELEKRVDVEALRSSAPEHVEHVERHRTTVAAQLADRKTQAQRAIDDARAFFDAGTIDDAHAAMLDAVQAEIRAKHPAPMPATEQEREADPPSGLVELEALVDALDLAEHPEQPPARACARCRELRKLFTYDRTDDGEARELCESCCVALDGAKLERLAAEEREREAERERDAAEIAALERDDERDDEHA